MQAEVHSGFLAAFESDSFGLGTGHDSGIEVDYRGCHPGLDFYSWV